MNKEMGKREKQKKMRIMKQWIKYMNKLKRN